MTVTNIDGQSHVGEARTTNAYEPSIVPVIGALAPAIGLLASAALLIWGHGFAYWLGAVLAVWFTLLLTAKAFA